MYQGKFVIQDAPKPNTPDISPAQTPPQRNRPPRKKRASRSRRGTIVFYSIYGLCVVAFLIAIACVMNPLRDWLVKYEASQPGNKRDAIFSELFLQQDWEQIYTLAQVADNKFENKSTFAAYMDRLVGDSELTCLETSAGLSGDKKYIVKLKDQKIASFTLTGGAESEAEIPQWQLGKVEVFFTGNQNVIVEKLPGQTVYINGVALDDSYTIRTVSTIAEKHLPEGLHGYRLIQQQVTGLLTVPEVIVRDASGTAIPVTLNPETGVYTQNIPPMQASEEEKQLALDAVKTYALYMICKVGPGEIGKYFDSSSDIYATIIRSEVGWMQSYASYRFTDPVYSDYYRYSDSLFSIYIDTTLEVTRNNGSIKEYDLGNTLFFAKNSNGKYFVTEITNANVQKITQQVRLTFMNENTVLSDDMIDADIHKLTVPVVTAPEGQVFKGWVKQTIDINGKITLTVVFEPMDSPDIYLPEGYLLEPMTLHALFEEAK